MDIFFSLPRRIDILNGIYIANYLVNLFRWLVYKNRFGTGRLQQWITYTPLKIFWIDVGQAVLKRDTSTANKTLSHYTLDWKFRMNCMNHFAELDILFDIALARVTFLRDFKSHAEHCKSISFTTTNRRLWICENLFISVFILDFQFFAKQLIISTFCIEFIYMKVWWLLYTFYEICNLQYICTKYFTCTFICPWTVLCQINWYISVFI